jgi:Rad3-related DNA helicase
VIDLTADLSVPSWPIWDRFKLPPKPDEEDEEDRFIRPRLRKEEVPPPGWFTAWRPYQEEAVAQAMAAYKAGTRIVVLQAPTGFGKSGAGYALRRRLGTWGAYVAENKALQGQMANVFPDAMLLQGRNNYRTLDAPHRRDISAEDCTVRTADSSLCLTAECQKAVALSPLNRLPKGKHCFLCHPVGDCPYRVARQRAFGANLAVLNTAYFVTVTNTGGAFSGVPFLIVDECDQLERTLMEQIRVNVPLGLWRDLDPAAGAFPFQQPPSFHQFIQPLLTPLAERLRALLKRLDARPSKDAAVALIREYRKLQRYYMKWETALDLDEDEWVFDPKEEEGKRQKDPLIQWRPVRVAPIADMVFWRHVGLVLMMSATVVDGEEMLASLGITDPADFTILKVPSTFPPARAPIIMVPLADTTQKNLAAGTQVLARGLQQIAAHHADHRILVNVPSFHLTRAVVPSLPEKRVFEYQKGMDAEQRVDLVTRFRESSTPGILIGPGLDRGLDFPGDACRVQVVAKLPFMSLGDAVVHARMNLPGGQRWYEIQAIRSFLQSLGRGMRAEDDWCISYVLDIQADQRLWSNWTGRNGDGVVWSHVVDRWYYQRIERRSPFGDEWLIPVEEWPT